MLWQPERYRHLGHRVLAILVVFSLIGLWSRLAMKNSLVEVSENSKRKSSSSFWQKKECTNKNISKTKDETRLFSVKSLLPHPLDLLRRNITLEVELNLPTSVDRNVSGKCSCDNADASFDCCVRTIHVAHKMGIFLSQTILEEYRDQIRRVSPTHNGLNDVSLSAYQTGVDFREVILLRNVYSALVSGYQYHAGNIEIVWLFNEASAAI